MESTKELCQVNKHRKYFVFTALLLNVTNILLVIYCVYEMFFSKTTQELSGKIALRYFTADSAIFSGFASILLCVFDILYLIRNINIPDWVRNIKLMAVTASALTFVIVIIALFCLYVFNVGLDGTELGYNRIVEGTNFLMHIICPILSVSAFLLEANSKLDEKKILLAFIPVLIYATIYIIFGLFLSEDDGGWGDLYSVKTIGIGAAVVISATSTALIAHLLIVSNNKIKEKLL